MQTTNDLKFRTCILSVAGKTCGQIHAAYARQLLDSSAPPPGV